MSINSNNVSSYSGGTKVALINSNANAFTGYCQVNTLRDIVCRRTVSCELPDSVDDRKDDSAADNIYGFNNITRYYQILPNK